MKVQCVNARVGKTGKDVRKHIVPSLLKEGAEYEVSPDTTGTKFVIQGGELNGRAYRQDRFQQV